ncbi:MAG TPA: hypothetical protein PLT25_01965 [Acidocella sp.]|nr:hypothetical protein [Acidocella sp.]HQU03462.1 hypothetical protein [Acidocella sp.]
MAGKASALAGAALVVRLRGVVPAAAVLRGLVVREGGREMA